MSRKDRQLRRLSTRLNRVRDNARELEKIWLETIVAGRRKVRDNIAGVEVRLCGDGSHEVSLRTKLRPFGRIDGKLKGPQLLNNGRKP